jgi:AbrB family looped-hinge helix DNA binding protein
MNTIMSRGITIDAAGRLVIPKSVRDRLGLRPGSRLQIREEDGQIVLRPERSEPALVDRGGFLAVDIGSSDAADLDHRRGREERLAALVEFALRR